MIQYSYDKLDGVKYSSNSEYSVYLVTLPRVDKTKYIEADGVKVSVPYNAEEILASIYNDDWRIPNPNWKSNSGKCSTLLKDKIAYSIGSIVGRKVCKDDKGSRKVSRYAVCVGRKFPKHQF